LSVYSTKPPATARRWGRGQSLKCWKIVTSWCSSLPENFSLKKKALFVMWPANIFSLDLAVVLKWYCTTVLNQFVKDV